MTTLRFRAWHSVDKILRQVKSLEFDDYGKLSHVWVLDDHGVPHKWEADECVLMQSTGLHDKNGKEKYEGDVVEMWDPFVAGPKRDCIRWNKRRAQWDGAHAGNVIGNIYENPDLLPPTP